MCSIVLPFFTVTFCAPDVVPVSPITVRLTPFCSAVDSKCTPLAPTALMAALYSACALGPFDAAPATCTGAAANAGERGESGEACTNCRRGGRGGPDGGWAHGLYFPGERAGARHTALIGPMDAAACGARGRTISPHLEYAMCSAVVA